MRRAIRRRLAMMLLVASRSEELQETTHFINCVSGTLKGHTLDDELVANSPESPREHPDGHPPNVAGRQGDGLNLREHVRDIGIAPLTADGFGKATREELSSDASEEDVIGVLQHVAQRTNPVARAIAFEHLHPRGNPVPDPLPQEDSVF
ncbi:hypothetical protein D1007_55285 [Hordeum vulgare]|nr:hypothetical protein D1007_55285 [Hordeum vulgare]